MEMGNVKQVKWVESLNMKGSRKKLVYVAANLKRAKGKILAMGDFSTIGGVSRKFLARLNENGTTDPTFTAGGGQGDLDKAPFRLLQLPGGLLLIGGEFTSVGGESQLYLARLRADGSFDKSFRPIINGPFYSMARQEEDGMILIGGDFTEVNGTASTWRRWRFNSTANI